MDCVGPILTADARTGIKEKYKYSGGKYTPLDNFMNPWWIWVTDTFFPIWLAPNLVTMIGFVAMATSFLISLYYPLVDPGNVPQWTFLYHAVALFFYQTMDSCDGKQARKTGTSSALGQLFDHGCDSMTTLFASVTLCASLGLGHYEMLIQISVALGTFFVAQWDEHHTHVLQTSLGGVYGVTEAQLTMVWVHLTAFLFPAFFDINAPPLLDLRALGVPFELPATVWLVYYFSLGVCCFSTLFKMIQIGLKYKGSLVLVAPVLLTCGATLYLATLTDLCGDVCRAPKSASLYSTMLMIAVGFTCTQSSNRMILASVAQVPYTPVWQAGHVLVLALAVVVALYGEHSIGCCHYPLLVVTLLVSVLTTFRHCIGVVNELCELLGIRVFVIKPITTKAA